MPCMIKVIGRFLGSIIRDACEVDIRPSSDCLGKFFRVRVAIKVDKPLRQFLRVDVLGDGEETAMPVQYELLLNLCFFCRLLRGGVGVVILRSRIRGFKRVTNLMDEALKFRQQPLMKSDGIRPLKLASSYDAQDGNILANDKDKGADLGVMGNFLYEQECERSGQKVWEILGGLGLEKHAVAGLDGGTPFKGMVGPSHSRSIVDSCISMNSKASEITIKGDLSERSGMRDAVSKVNCCVKNLDRWNKIHCQALRREIRNKKKEELAIALGVVGFILGKLFGRLSPA
ncbi:hypothetical protein QYF36_017079 [Acer negundo]|nr:hypothetical protein QYF36_017079 [Acer negundo]